MQFEFHLLVEISEFNPPPSNLLYTLLLTFVYCNTFDSSKLMLVLSARACLGSLGFHCIHPFLICQCYMTLALGGVIQIPLGIKVYYNTGARVEQR